MQVTRAFQELGKNDAKLIGRDSFLVGMLVYSVFTSLLMRFGLPYVNEMTLDNEQVPFILADYYPMLIGFLIVFMAAVFAGMIIGFMLLDERDDNTIKAMLVSPLPIHYYLGYRVALPMVLTFGLVVMEMFVVNLALVAWWQIVLIALAASTTAPIITLFFASFAENKVQGFALTKFTGVAGVLVMMAWFVEEPLQLLFGVFPPFWITKGYWLALEGNPYWGLALLIGAGLNLLIITALARYFQRVVYQ